MKLVFKSLKDLQNLGVEGLYKEFLNELKELEDIYMFTYEDSNSPMEFENLFESSIDELNWKKISEIKPYLKTLSTNIIKLAEEKDKYIYDIFRHNESLYIFFEVSTYKVYDMKDITYRNLQITINKYDNKNKGMILRAYINNYEKFIEIIDNVNKMNITEQLKQRFIDYFKYSAEYHYSINDVIKDIKDYINNCIDNYMDEYDDVFEVDSSLKECDIENLIINYLRKDEYFKDIIPYIRVNYVTNDKVEILFLDKVIKKISKHTYFKYEIKREDIK